MRLVVATTSEDPLGGIFWEAYRATGGLPPSAVFLITPKRQSPFARKVLEALLLFGVGDSMRSWMWGRRHRAMLQTHPDALFPGTTVFHRVTTLNRGEGLAALRAESPALLISVGAPEIFKPAVLELPAIAAVNVHNGRLPAYRGLFGTFWEAFSGEEWGYSSLHVMAQEVDAGPVLAESAIPLPRRSLLAALVAKKTLSGRLLAWLVRTVERDGELPPPRPPQELLQEGYYSWPSLRHILRYRLSRSTPFTPRRPVGSRAASWPPDAVIEG